MELQQYEKEHLEKLRALLPECTVLLKSDGSFPLPVAGKLALYGNGARHTLKGGTGSGEVNSRYFVTVEEGLRQAGFEITTDSWLNGYDAVCAEAKKQFLKDVKARAREKHTNVIIEGMGAVMPEPEYDLPLDGDGDTAVYVLSRICGEGNDRTHSPGDILLTKTEERQILALQKQYKRFMLVLNVGGPVDLTPVLGVGNILILSQLGVDTGAVLGDLLLGKAYPSGKLSTTWAAADDYAPIGDFGNLTDTRYKEGVYVGYRYFDSVGKRAMFPFGFGLGYTEFAVSPADVRAEGESLFVRAHVKNTGKHPGKEVVQLYVSVPQGKLDQPYQTLAAFKKTAELLPGEEQEVLLTCRLSELASFDSDAAAYILESGDYILRLGNGSTDTVPCAAVKLEKTVIVKQVRHIGGTADFEDWKPEAVRQDPLPDGLPVLVIAPEAICTETVSYDQQEEIDPCTETFTEEELAYMNIGAFDPKGGILSVIGNASKNVAGAAGESTGMLQNKGVAPLVMADGPAGLRLSRDYAVDDKGIHPLGQTMPSTVLDFLPKPIVKIMELTTPKPKKGAKIHHQYTTAIPIGTAMAQSWNRELAFACGDIVGAEMERFGVHLWLAPALNIHRSIRCGRNFEYYAEDPLLSGILAAEVTKGVQKHPGRGTTIKHFAANNQETNRYCSNSVMSERALRDIYLRGFGICAQEAQPHAVMTSYNLLNGMHTSERRDLTADYLRSENGFKGVVMTDWLVGSEMLSQGSVYPAPTAAGIAAAGGDLVMPGRKEDFKNIRKALKNGTLSRKTLQVNATRLLRLIGLLRP